MKKERHYVKITSISSISMEDGAIFFEAKGTKGHSCNPIRHRYHGQMYQVEKGDEFQLTVVADENSTTGNDYEILEWERIIGSSLKNIEKYLCSIPNIGETKAKLITKKDKGKTLEQLLSSDSALDHTDFSDTTKSDIFFAVRKDQLFKELIEFFYEHKILRKFAAPLLDQYKHSVMDTVKTLPCTLYYTSSSKGASGCDCHGINPIC